MPPGGFESSFYQQFKSAITAVIPIGRNEWHIVIGALFVLGFLLVPRWRRSGRAALAMFASALALGIAMEVLDLYDEFRFLGQLKWSASAVDILRTILIPVLYLVTRWFVPPRRHRLKPSMAESKIPPEIRDRG